MISTSLILRAGFAVWMLSEMMNFCKQSAMQICKAGNGGYGQHSITDRIMLGNLLTSKSIPEYISNSWFMRNTDIAKIESLRFSAAGFVWPVCTLYVQLGLET